MCGLFGVAFANKGYITKLCKNPPICGGNVQIGAFKLQFESANFFYHILALYVTITIQFIMKKFIKRLKLNWRLL